MVSPEYSLNRILFLARPLFQLATPLKKEVLEEAVFKEYRIKVCLALKKFEKQILNAAYNPTVVEQARYALIAYLDECVLHSSWSGRTHWMSQPLQVEFFGEYSAGDVFFDRLQRLRLSGRDAIELLELYYVCIQLGFKGRYRLKEFAQLISLQVDLKNQIETIRGDPLDQLSPPKACEEEVVMLWTHRISQKSIVIGTLSAIAILYGLFFMAMIYKTNRYIDQIEMLESTVSKPWPSQSVQEEISIRTQTKRNIT